MAFENSGAMDFLWKALKIDPKEIERSMLSTVQSIEIMKKFMISVDERLTAIQQQQERLLMLLQPVPLLKNGELKSEPPSQETGETLP